MKANELSACNIGGSVMKKGKSNGKTTDMSVRTEAQDLEAVIEYAQRLPCYCVTVIYYHRKIY